MKLKFFNRDGTEKPIQPAVDFEIQRYGWDVMGGPVQAAVTARGERGALFELVNHMREPVEILTDRGECVWWGYLGTLDITWGAIQFGVDINTMFNRIAVAYTNGPLRYTTQWSGDADSISEYGYKEMLLSHSDCTEGDALSERDVYLAGAKHPIPTLKFGSGSSGQASLTLRGWYSTLEWQYYVNETGFEGYDVSGQGGREVGEDDRPILAMSFQIGSALGWTATTLWLHVWWQGDHQPSDNLTVSICADSTGIPDTVLASAQIAGSAVDRSAEWLEFPLSSGVALEPSTTYWIKVARSGAVDPDAYYMLDTNGFGYLRGSMLLWNTNLNRWVDATTKGDLLFKLQGTLSTTAQIQTLVATAGQFFTGSIVEASSGVETVPYRSGDSTARYELEKLLGIGTANNRRLLVEATRNMYLRIYEEPAKPGALNASYGLGPDGTLYFPGTRNPVDPELCPVGIWAALVDVIPPTVDLSLIADPNRFLIEAAEFDVTGGKLNIQRTKDQMNVYDIGGVEQG